MNNSNTDAILKSLQQAYLEGRFAEGIKEAHKAQQDLLPVDYHKTIAGLYLKTGDYAASRYHLESARSLGAMDEYTAHNLSYIQQELLGLNRLEQTVPHKWQEYLVSWPKEAYISASLLLLALVWIFWKKLGLSIWPKLILIVLAFVPVFFYAQHIRNLQAAIVLTPATISEGPSQIFEPTGEIPAGLKVLIGEESGGYQFIRSPKSYSGWIEVKNLGILP